MWLLALLLLPWGVATPLPVAAQPGGGPSPVDAGEVVEGPVYQEVRLTGSIQPRRAVEVSTQAEGAVAELLVDEGALVREGEVIARLLDTPARLQLGEAQAQLALAEAALVELRNGSRAEELAMRRAELDDARARLALAELESRRAASLLERQAVSQSDADRATAERDRAAADVALNQAELERAVNGARAEELARAEAQRAAAASRVAQLEDLVARHELRAPFTGIVGAKMTEVGAWAKVGDPVVSMAELDVLRVAVALPERHFNDVEPGTPVTLAFDALPDSEVEGTVTIRIPLADAASRTFPLRIDIPNDGYRLAPGMMARVRIAVGRDRGETALLLPKDAVVMAPDGSRTVWVVRPADEGGLKVFPQRVTTGREFADKVELVGDGLRAGDRVVIRGNEILRPGQPVAIRGEQAPSASGHGAPASPDHPA